MSDNLEAISIGIQNAFSFAGYIAQEQFAHIGFEATRPSVLFRPTVSIDGDHYCVLYGEDLVAGCAGFGKSLAEAMADFDKNWGTPLPERMAA